jgi:hypothetical protein
VRHPKFVMVPLHPITVIPGRALTLPPPCTVQPPEETTIATPISPTTNLLIPVFDSLLKDPSLLSMLRRMVPPLATVLYSHRCHSVVLYRMQDMVPWEWEQVCQLVNLALYLASVTLVQPMEEAGME